MRAFKSSHVNVSPSTDETPVHALCAGYEIASYADTGLCSSLRAPNAGQLLLGLPSPPVVEEPLVDGQRDAARSQRIADAEREAPRDGRRFDPEALRDAHHLLEGRSVDVDPAAPDLIGAELLGRAHLEADAERFDPRRLHGADRHDAPIAELRIDERIRDRRAVPRGGARAPSRCRRRSEGSRAPILPRAG